MFRKMLPLPTLSAAALALTVLAALVLMPRASHAKPPVTLKSLNLTLPASGRMYPGPGAEAINGNCLGCHSADMVLNQPNMPKAAWAGEVAKMINTFKAPVNKPDVPAIVDYLARHKGVK